MDKHERRLQNEAFWTRLWRFLARQAGTTSAEDLVAETFLTAWSARGTYQAEQRSRPGCTASPSTCCAGITARRPSINGYQDVCGPVS
jgi:hypothetical protein